MARLSDTLPMFHRRLFLLWSGMLLIFGVLGLQILRLSIADGGHLLDRAESSLDRSSLLPTYRGRILDRNGKVLAADRPSFDVAVPFAVITGSWETTQARRLARQELGATRWAEMSPGEQTAAARPHRADLEAITAQLWQALREAGDLTEEEMTARRDEIRARVNRLAADVWEKQRIAWEREQERRSRERPFRRQDLVEHRQAHVILPRVSDDLAFPFRALAHRHRGLVEVRDVGRRVYPWLETSVVIDRSSLPAALRSDEPLEVTITGVADHIVGAVRADVWEEDVERRPFVDPATGVVDLGGYLPGDRVGARGLELTHERWLRGTRGRIIERVDSGQMNRVDAVPGHDLQVTLDIMLQARVQAIMGGDLGLTVVQPWHGNKTLEVGRPLYGAAVMIEIATGEILAMVSMPTLAMGAQMTDLERAIVQPQYERVSEVIHPPGSIIKPLVLAVAHQEGQVDLGEMITCTGHFFPKAKDSLRCWIYRPEYGFATHGDLEASEALGQSCNIYFYTLADRLELLPLARGLERFGVGRTLLGPVAGHLPKEADEKRLREERRLRPATVALGIGQGPVTWTPLHAANAYATIARGGVIRDATLLMHDPDGTRPPGRQDLEMSERLRRTILDGLRISVEEERGTGHHITYPETGQREPIINAPGVRVWAKTGTAEAPPLRTDSDGDGQLTKADVPTRGVDHSWFVGMVGPGRARDPLYVIAVIVEYGGSGGRVAGPVANQIVRALQEEHYLPGGGPS